MKRALILCVCVILPAIIILYSLLFWLVEFPVITSKNKTKINRYCEGIKDIGEFEDFNKEAMSIDYFNTEIKTVKYIYFDDTSNEGQAEVIEHSKFSIFLEYKDKKLSRIDFLDHNDEFYEMLFDNTYTFAYRITDDNTFVRFGYKGDEEELSQTEWEEHLMKDFYLHSPYDSTGKISYIDIALNNIDRITKKAYTYTVYSSVDNLNIEFKIQDMEGNLRYKLYITEYEFDEFGRVLTEKSFLYDFY